MMILKVRTIFTSFCPKRVRLMSPRFTVYTHNRRDSGRAGSHTPRWSQQPRATSSRVPSPRLPRCPRPPRALPSLRVPLPAQRQPTRPPRPRHYSTPRARTCAQCPGLRAAGRGGERRPGEYRKRKGGRKRGWRVRDNVRLGRLATARRSRCRSASHSCWVLRSS